MADYLATVHWQRQQQTFTDNKYSRGHDWIFDGGVTVPASSSPHVVPLPYSVETHVDPEEAFVASLSSCHMLFFLSLAVSAGFCVDDYRDEAAGTMGKDSDGNIAMLRVSLRPQIQFSGTQPNAEQIAHLHHLAHQRCFIANSVKTEVVVESV